MGRIVQDPAPRISPHGSQPLNDGVPMLIALPNRPVLIMFLDKSKSRFFGFAMLMAGLL